MEIGAADARASHSDNGIFRMQNLRHGFMVDTDPLRASEVHGKHVLAPVDFGMFDVAGSSLQP
jgi:hypothetical protein